MICYDRRRKTRFMWRPCIEFPGNLQYRDFKKGHREVQTGENMSSRRDVERRTAEMYPIPRPVPLDITVLLPMALPSRTPLASTCQKAAYEGWCHWSLEVYALKALPKQQVANFGGPSMHGSVSP